MSSNSKVGDDSSQIDDREEVHPRSALNDFDACRRGLELVGREPRRHRPDRRETLLMVLDKSDRVDPPIRKRWKDLSQRADPFIHAEFARPPLFAKDDERKRRDGKGDRLVRGVDPNVMLIGLVEFPRHAS